MYDEYRRELKKIYEDALHEVEANNFNQANKLGLNDTLVSYVDHLIDRVDSFKAVVSVTITSILKKIITPDQDIRLHKTDFEGGYSGRSLDTAVVTPFLKDQGLKSMAESGWLTRSLEQPHSFDLNFPGKIRDQSIKDGFLHVLDIVETEDVDDRKLLNYILQKLILKKEADKIDIEPLEDSDIYISEIIDKLEDHFRICSASGTSRLPVLAIYSIYQCMMDQMKRFDGKTLKPLENHTSSDIRSKSIGDVQINLGEDPFEGVEVKYDRPITHTMIENAYEKFREYPVRRYYLLSTLPVKDSEQEKVNEVIKFIKREHGCQVIVNGLLPTIKYYLRLLDEPTPFINYYSENVLNDEVTRPEHKEAWKELVSDL